MMRLKGTWPLWLISYTAALLATYGRLYSSVVHFLAQRIAKSVAIKEKN